MYAHLSLPYGESRTRGKSLSLLSPRFVESRGMMYRAHNPCINSNKGRRREIFRVSIDSSIDFNCTIVEEEEKNGRTLDMYRDMHATNVINEQRCSCTRRILRNHVIRGNRSRDHAREEVISNYSTISEVALSDLASGLVDREWIIRERKKEKDQAFKLFAKLLLG